MKSFQQQNLIVATIITVTMDNPPTSVSIELADPAWGIWGKCLPALFLLPILPHIKQWNKVAVEHYHSKNS